MKKLIVDILLFILMILEFSRMYMPPIWHEIIGILLIVLIIIHLILNRNYIKNIFKGKYNLKRIIMLIINVLFMISFILSCIFGLLSSEELLKFLRNSKKLKYFRNFNIKARTPQKIKAIIQINCRK